MKRSKKTTKATTKVWRGRSLDSIAMIADAASNLVESATKLGRHQARAELMAPMLRTLRYQASLDGTPQAMHAGVFLNITDCALLLSCLAEAGYRPAPQGGEEMHWQAMPQPVTEDGQPADVAKAA